MPRDMVSTCRKIADSGRFQASIFVLIVANAITLGLGTYDFSASVDSLITTLDDIFLGIFVAELVRTSRSCAWPVCCASFAWSV